MTLYDLAALTVLLVEDNDYVRKIMKEVLRDLSVGEVIAVENGVEAVGVLRTGAGQHYEKPIDLVISDLIMAPMDGLLLLKWLRLNKASPNRFMPFIMMSGAADREGVAEARDCGATEFLAKPFSAQSVSDKILQVIDRPRQFVASGNYFGPDRHRRQNSVEVERRKNDPSRAHIVYTNTATTRPPKPGEVYLFRLNNELKIKAGGLGVSGAGKLPLAVLKEADERLQRESLEFHDWATGYLMTVSSLCDRALTIAETARRPHFKNINLLAHELRSQGGTFGYPLITVVGKMLYETTHPLCPMNDRAISIVKAHVDTMYTVFRDRVTGEGGEIGQELIASLGQSINRFMRAAATPS